MLVGIMRSIIIGIPDSEVSEGSWGRFAESLRKMFKPLPTRVSIVELSHCKILFTYI